MSEFPHDIERAARRKTNRKGKAVINRKCVIHVSHVRVCRDGLVVSVKVVRSRSGRVRPKTIIKFV